MTRDILEDTRDYHKPATAGRELGRGYYWVRSAIYPCVLYEKCAGRVGVIAQYASGCLDYWHISSLLTRTVSSDYHALAEAWNLYTKNKSLRDLESRT